MQSHNHNWRPKSSINMVDLPIYVVPVDLWDERQNMALSEIISETASAGFLRVEPEQPISDLRIEIDEQLGYDIIPKDFVFCKSVGRCLAQVREKQEILLKAKHFLPPNSYNPELFVVDSIVAKRHPLTSDSNKTFNSSSGTETRVGRKSVERSLLQERIAQDQQEDKGSFDYEVEDSIKQMEIKEKENDENLNVETERKSYERHVDIGKIVIPVIPREDAQIVSRRKEIEDLQDEIMKRYQQLTTLENEHQKKISEWEYEEQHRQQEEEERRHLFEEMEMERRKQEQAIIAKQKEELQKLEAMLKNKHDEIHLIEEQLETQRNNRIEIRKIKEEEMKNLREQFEDNAKIDPLANDRIQQLQKELEEMEKKQRELEDIARMEREQAEIDFEKAQIEFERLKTHWEEEKRLRDKENSARLLEEQRLRNISEERRREHELHMEEERRRMIEERERFDEEQKHWDEERIRYENEEKKRLMEMDMAIQDAYTNKPDFQRFEVRDSFSIVEFEPNVTEKTNLKRLLKTVKSEREIEEKVRDNAIKKVRILQMKMQNRRSNLRDIWKKKYLDEKNKTPALEDQLSRFKDELENIHRKLINTIEAGLKDSKMLPRHPGVLSPSNKANLFLEAFRIQHEIEDIKQKIGFNQMRLAAERKLRAQTETELKLLKIEAMQKKIRLSRTRSDQLALVSSNNSLDLTSTPHNNIQTNGSVFISDSVTF